MKRFTTIVTFLLLILGLIFLIVPINWLPSFYDVRYTACSMLASALAIYFLPKVLQVPINSVQAEEKNKSVELLQFLLALAIVADALGVLGLYELYTIGIQYDKLLHFFIPVVSISIFYSVLKIRFSLQPSRALLLAFSLGIICGLGWELIEYLSDNLFGSHLQGFLRSDIYNDTFFDLLCDSLGSILGTILAPRLSTFLLRKQ